MTEDHKVSDGETPTPTLGPYISAATLKPRLSACYKKAAIEELLGLLFATGAVSDRDAARDAVMEREQAMSTGMQDGLAMPHAKTDAVTRTVCAVGLQPDGIDFDSLDDKPSNIVVLALSPAADASAHLKFMSTVSKVLNGEGKGREALLACETPEDMLTILS